MRADVVSRTRLPAVLEAGQHRRHTSSMRHLPSRLARFALLCTSRPRGGLKALPPSQPVVSPGQLRPHGVVAAAQSSWQRLLQGVAFELSHGCSNMKGKVYFSDFLVTSLEQLPSATPGLAQLQAQAATYRVLPAHTRQELLQQISVLGAEAQGLRYPFPSKPRHAGNNGGECQQEDGSNAQPGAPPRIQWPHDNGWTSASVDGRGAGQPSVSFCAGSGLLRRRRLPPSPVLVEHTLETQPVALNGNDAVASSSLQVPTPQSATAATPLWPSAVNKPSRLAAPGWLSAGQPRYIFLDTETSGYSFQSGGRIVEIAALDSHTGVHMSSLVNISPHTIPHHVTAVHGITNADVRRPGVPSMREAGAAFLDFVERCCKGYTPVLVAHNGRKFDLPFLQAELSSCSMSLGSHWHWLDTMILARPLGFKSNAQDNLRSEFGLAPSAQAHRALDDTVVLSQIFPHLLAAAKLQSPDELLHKKASCTGLVADLMGAAKMQSPRKKPAAALNTEDVDLEEAAQLALQPDPVTMVEAAWHDRGQLLPAGLPVAPAAWDLARKASREPAGWLLDVPVDKAKPLTPGQRSKLAAAGFGNLWDVLQHYPREYVHYTSNLRDGEHVILPGVVQSSKGVSIKKFNKWQAMVALGGSASCNAGSRQQVYTEGDDQERMDSIAAPSPPLISVTKIAAGHAGSFVVKKLTADHPEGADIVLRGKLKYLHGNIWELEGPEVFKPEDKAKALAAGEEVVPIYPAKQSVKPIDFTKLMPRLLQAIDDVPPEQCTDPMPSMVLEQHNMMAWKEAIQAIHLPQDLALAEAGRQRLAFDELLSLQLILLIRRELLRMPRDAAEHAKIAITDTTMMQAGLAALPFTLTGAQDRVLREIVADMESAPPPMMRLLQGDVGSGKTAVAFLALLAVAGSGGQGALMAPTEVLAEQHHAKLQALVQSMPPEQQPRVALLTGSTKPKDRRQVLECLATGEVDLIIGTHALISASVKYKALALAVIDEQHRFGVEQRARLQAKTSPPPHVLAMTATPIPRTLLLVAHGDMEQCILNELPPGRSPVTTHLIPDGLYVYPSNRNQMYAHIKTELAQGGSVYIICPLVEESSVPSMAEMKAAQQEYERLQEENVLGDVQCGLLHGRLSGQEKVDALQRFASGEKPVLIATTVVEVGVDVPEATIMVVEHAERFGLAQLHQLRGRVGRGTRQSTCYLVSSDPAAAARLAVMERFQDGFAIAQADLLHRGPGNVLGVKQSGREALVALKACRLPGDHRLLETARSSAAELLQTLGTDPTCWPPLLIKAMDRTLPELDVLPLNGLSDASMATA